ncbi:MAG: YggS family pyridoxal phosphate-dependent enzyme, partial [Oscillospiraceae bacterium]|nr:YggS family pyridoxal phosphate-dependent enzyme [Oscillospiraceae bacterium]
MSIADNVARVRERMADAAARAGRKDMPRLVAATKTRTSDEVRQVIMAGVDACGENRVQEMTQKLSENAYVDSPLHLIGTLQRNKVKYVVGAADLVESVNSIALMDEIERCAIKLDTVQ